MPVNKEAPSPPYPSEAAIDRAFERLATARGLEMLVRGALPLPYLKRVLKGAIPRRKAAEMPDEVFASLAAEIAFQNPQFRLTLADALHDHVGWDQPPAGMELWWEAVRERPLEAIWMAALSEDKAVRKEFPHLASHCIENHRSSPDAPPPSWDYIEGLLDVQAITVKDLREAEKVAEDAERKLEAERERLEELRGELKKLRRENSELRAERAQLERRAAALEQRVAAAEEAAQERPASASEDLENRLRKSDKEREHLFREIERLREELGQARAAAALAPPPGPETGDAEVEDLGEPVQEPETNPRRRVLRQILRKLFTKGKIGASHTHEDNVYRGVPDHDKGLAKTAMELLYLEGFFMPKPTTADPHVSIRAERLPEVQGIIAGQVSNPRLLRFIEG